MSLLLLFKSSVANPTADPINVPVSLPSPDVSYGGTVAVADFIAISTSIPNPSVTLGNSISEANSIGISVSLPNPEAIAPALASPLQVSVSLFAEAQLSPIICTANTISCAMILRECSVTSSLPPVELSGSDVWAGVFQLPPLGIKYFEHIQRITANGFTVMGVDHYSGRSDVFCRGPRSSVTIAINDYNTGLDVESYFFQLPEGVQVTKSLIKKWANRSDVVFLE